MPVIATEKFQVELDPPPISPPPGPPPVYVLPYLMGKADGGMILTDGLTVLFPAIVFKATHGPMPGTFKISASQQSNVKAGGKKVLCVGDESAQVTIVFPPLSPTLAPEVANIKCKIIDGGQTNCQAS